MPPAEPVIAGELLENAKKSLESDTLKRTAKCIVCGNLCAPNSAEGLCWVCRRLKISAWKETDQQISIQE
jgi:rubrerythrin